MATQGSRNSSDALPSLSAELSTLRAEWAASVAHTEAPLELFAKAMFTRITRTNGAKKVDSEIWDRATAAADSIATRDDIKALIAELGEQSEEYMYLPLDLLSEIAMKTQAQVKGGSRNLPPQPYVLRVEGKEPADTWVKTPDAKAYSPEYEPEFCFVNTHGSPLSDLHVKEK